VKPRSGTSSLILAGATGVVAFVLFVVGVAVLISGGTMLLGWSLLGLAFASVAATATLTVAGTRPDSL
jgi:hypothetical protein